MANSARSQSENEEGERGALLAMLQEAVVALSLAESPAERAMK